MDFKSLEARIPKEKTPVVLSMPYDEETILAAQEAMELGYADFSFVGKPERMDAALKKAKASFSPRFYEALDEESIANLSMELIHSGKAKVLMKGSISTPILLKSLLNRQPDKRKYKIVSRVFVFEWGGRLKFLTDGGMVPHPTISEKQEIISNVVQFAHRLGFERPKIAILSAVETVNLKMQSTVDAAILSKMGERGQFGNCLVEGPLALDNAISLEAARNKGILNEVAGAADVLICPDIDSGNILGKSIIYFAKVPAGGILLGAGFPVIMLSRADKKNVRLNSIKLALAAGV